MTECLTEPEKQSFHVPLAERAEVRLRTPEYCAKSSLAHRGKPLSEAHRNAMRGRAGTYVRTPEIRAKASLAMRGKKNALGWKQTAEHIAKLSKVRRGRRHSAETRAKISAVLRGRVLSPESRAKISAVLRGRVLSPESRARISAALKGRSPSPEARAKMSAAKKGNKYALGHRQSVETRLRISAAGKGRHHSTEARARISAAKRGRRNPMWLGGISRAPYAWTFNDELKEEVRRRDGHKCQLCGTPQTEGTRALPVHHIDYSKTNSDPVNLVVLCRQCHARTNKNRVYWRMFFMERVLARARQGMLF